MALLTNIAILLFLACVSHQLMLGSGQKGHGRRGRGVDRGQHRERSGPKVGRPHSSSVPAQPVGGKVVTKDKSECSWAATGEDVITLRVTCNKGDRRISCDYVAKPSLCPQYASNISRYWRHVAKALRRQRSLCQDRGAVVRAGTCRKAARDAHFRLSDTRMKTKMRQTPRPAATDVKSCVPAHEKLADQYCNDSWSSFCTFFFTMVQDYDC